MRTEVVVVETPFKARKRPSKRVSRANKGKDTTNKKKKRTGAKSVSQLVKELDTVFSRWVRLSHADSEGMVECYTCRKSFHYKKIHAGHYISRFYKQTRWSEVNVQPQCPMCNLWKKGDPQTFRERLVSEYGRIGIEDMEESRSISQKLDVLWLMEKIASYTAKVDSLRKNMIE